jgi:hypothetical protein
MPCGCWSGITHGCWHGNFLDVAWHVDVDVPWHMNADMETWITLHGTWMIASRLGDTILLFLPSLTIEKLFWRMKHFINFSKPWSSMIDDFFWKFSIDNQWSMISFHFLPSMIDDWRFHYTFRHWWLMISFEFSSSVIDNLFPLSLHTSSKLFKLQKLRIYPQNFIGPRHWYSISKWS